jgi:uncharacterized protein YabE (DUF348 family)
MVDSVVKFLFHPLQSGICFYILSTSQDTLSTFLFSRKSGRGDGVRLPKSKALYVSALTVLALLGGTAATFYKAAHKTITVQDNGERKTISGFATGSLESFLKTEGVSVTNRDRISPSLNASVQDGMVVQIEHARSVQFIYGGHMAKIQTFANTVQDFLQQEHVVLVAGDELIQSPLSSVSDGETIVLHQRRTKVTTKAQEVPFQTIRQRTGKLFVGQERVLTHGVKGLLDVDTTHVSIDGHQVGQTVSKHVVRKPVNEVIEMGTVTRPAGLSSRSASMGSITGELTVYATAYVSGGVTSTGWSARSGVVAVDPSVIPYGTKLYVPGIGVVRAEDTGGAIRGRHIDICLDTNGEANSWGARTIIVYVLG